MQRGVWYLIHGSIWHDELLIADWLQKDLHQHHQGKLWCKQRQAFYSKWGLMQKCFMSIWIVCFDGAKLLSQSQTSSSAKVMRLVLVSRTYQAPSMCGLLILPIKKSPTASATAEQVDFYKWTWLINSSVEQQVELTASRCWAEAILFPANLSLNQTSTPFQHSYILY